MDIETGTIISVNVAKGVCDILLPRGAFLYDVPILGRPAARTLEDTAGFPTIEEQWPRSSVLMERLISWQQCPCLPYQRFLPHLK